MGSGSMLAMQVEGPTSWPKGTCNARTLRNLGRQRLQTSAGNGKPPQRLSEDTVKEYCSSSITRLLALMAKLPYQLIATVGVDLNSPDHFYSHCYTHMGFEAMARQHGLKFVTNATVAATGLAEHSHHATAFRGVPLFLERFSSEVIQLINLAPASLLASSSTIRTHKLSTFVSAPPPFVREWNELWSSRHRRNHADQHDYQHADQHDYQHDYQHHVPTKAATPTRCPQRYLTYGSACQDCTFDSQRMDLVNAVQLAWLTNRTLVVRDIVCSSASPCHSTTGTIGDAVVPTLGGVDAWHAACNEGFHSAGVQANMHVCDASRVLREADTSSAQGLGDASAAALRWGTGVRRLPAQLLFDGAFMAQAGICYMWADAFHANHSALIGPAASSKWVLVPQRRSGELTDSEERAPVWHAAHLHKRSTLKPMVMRWPELLKTPRVKYARWLHELANAYLQAAGLRGARSSFIAAHLRLGDWASERGCDNCTFASDEYARALRFLVSGATKRRGGSGQEWRTWPLFLADMPRNLPWLVTALVLSLEKAGFKVLTSASFASQMEQKSRAYLGGPLPADVRSCVEQLICSQVRVAVCARVSC
jgi:hypothetical protein